MKRATRSRSWGAGLVSAIAATGCDGSVETLPPYGEALLIVDTDLPKPELASRLRVDLYSENGRWFESRDIGRSDARDWPATFSVYSDDASRPRRVLVRLRAYPEGITRTYEGERFAERPKYESPRIAENLGELCSNAPVLPIGGRVTMRRGGRAITETLVQGKCTAPNAGGSVAATINIEREGTYRFSVAGGDPYELDATLFVRSRCEDPSSQVACGAEQTSPPNSSGHFPRLDVKLTPGAYTLMTGAELSEWPADLTLEAIQIDGPIASLPPLESADAGARKDTLGPRLSRSPFDETPRTEPLPGATVDRLVVVRLEPGKRGSLAVTLRGACVGTMAKLGADPGAPGLASAETCVDRENERAFVTESELGSFDTTVAAKSAMPIAPLDLGPGCEGDTGDGSVICHPPGAFLFGSRAVLFGLSTPMQGSPERIALLRRFWLDRVEVSVERFRAVIARGFVVPPNGVFVNDGRYGVFDDREEDFPSFCTFSTVPATRERLPINCISWSAARAFCRAEGGDLPSEVQWEYAATKAGRTFKTEFPWGNETGLCERGVFGRFKNVGAPCLPPDGSDIGGPMAVDAFSTMDVTPLGVVGLAGNVFEWMLDGAASFSSTCWRAAALHDTACVDDNAPLRVFRGSGWIDIAAPATLRNFLPGAMPASGRAMVATPHPGSGFRCAYPERPRR